MFESLLNFRPVGGPLFYKYQDNPFVNAKVINAYRSARVDNVSPEDLKLLSCQLEIRSVIDLRNCKDEYPKESGEKLLDSIEMNPKVVDMEQMEGSHSNGILWLQDFAKLFHKDCDTHSSISHFMINVMGKGFVIGLIKSNQLSIWKKIWGLFLLLLYILFKADFFIRFISHEIYQTGLLRLYKTIVDFSGVSLCCALQLINQPDNLPCIICCHAGKDRTGVLSAILLSICGFDRATIADDYVLSEIGLPITHVEMKDYEESNKHSPRNVMLQLLDHIDKKYGSMSKYLTSIGFSVEEQANLKKLLMPN